MPLTSRSLTLPRIAALWLLPVSIGMAADEASCATRVDIIIDEPTVDRQVAWPVTTGVPFPRGELLDVEQCRLIDDHGIEQPLQARVAATWDRQRRSIRWLTIDFLAQAGRSYALEFGPDVRRKPFDSQIRIDRGNHVQVVTGAVAVDFLSVGPSALGPIRVDLNQDGEIDADETIALGAMQGDHYYIDQAGRRFSSAGDGEDRTITVESSGPVRACVRVDGHYSGLGGQRIVKYRTRYHFFAGLPLVKVVDEFGIVGSTRNTRFRDIGFALDLVEGVKDRMVVVDASADKGNQTQRVTWTPATTSVASYQSTYRHFGNPEYEAAVVHVDAAGSHRLRQTDRMGEWMQVAGPRSSVTGSLRWFHQQFPKEWEATPNQLILHLWSPRAGRPLDFGPDGLRRFFGEAGRKYLLEWNGVSGTRTPISNYFYYAGHAALAAGDVDGQGINKHHEFYLHFGDAKQAGRGQAYAQLAARQPLALASGKWNCSTDVFGPLMPRPNDSPYEAIVDRLFDLGRDAQNDFGDYGWWAFGSGPHYSYQWDATAKRHYADPRRFEYHTYQKETQLWWNYLRSGERKFYDWAIPSEDHWVDIAVTHVPLKYQCAWRGGVRQQQTLHFRPGDWSIDSPLHYVRQRDSAEAWLRGGSQFWATYHRTLETTTLAYYLTGDERYHDVLEFWQNYWRDLAGKTSASTNFKPWHLEQPWFVPAKPGEPPKSWAKMIRDYAPFTSGLRHQMTQFFNLATLYEHCWDPAIGQALRECADAYLDPRHRIGVWRTQENDLPNFADAPKLAHYWVPALWKYGRATGDPRMKEIFQRYFDACYGTDPFRENVGQYSNVHLGYAYYFTRDSRHLRPIKTELERLLRNAAPLDRPQDLNQRLYNPYAPISCFTAVPRLVWALDAARRQGVNIPPPPRLGLQRTAIALPKVRGETLNAALWGFDRRPRIIGPTGRPYDGFRLNSRPYSSDIQPFDRKLTGLEAFLHDLTIPASAPPGWYVIVPTLELAVLNLERGQPLVNAARPVACDAGEGYSWKLQHNVTSLQLESADLRSLRVQGPDGQVIKAVMKDNRLQADLRSIAAGKAIHIRNNGPRRAWFRMVGLPLEHCWLATSAEALATSPARRQTLAGLPPVAKPPADALFVPGRFGRALLITGSRELHIPDSVEVDGKLVRLFDMKQGTIEFWVRQLWDDRIASPKRVRFLSNGPLQADIPWELPLREWAHVAVEWRPLKRDPNRQAVHVYVNGMDQQNYRSTWWKGYSQRPRTFAKTATWLKAFVAKTQAGRPFAIDEIRVSAIPRYAQVDVELGAQQVSNPSRFNPPANEFEMDQHALLLLHLNDNLIAGSRRIERPITAEVKSAGRK